MVQGSAPDFTDGLGISAPMQFRIHLPNSGARRQAQGGRASSMEAEADESGWSQFWFGEEHTEYRRARISQYSLPL